MQSISEKRFPGQRGFSEHFPIVAVACALSFGLYYLQGDVLLGLQDEGFLLYGVWRTSLGEVPLRDFAAYDPGRYYWGALWVWMFGYSVGVVRLSAAAFQAIGLIFGLLLLRKINPSWWFILMGGAILCLWMYPRYKTFEPVIALAGVYFAFRVLERPNAARYFVAGVFLGLAAWFGRNHGLYGIVGYLLVIGIGLWKVDNSRVPRKLAVFSLGVVVGFLPILYAVLFVPGFYDSFAESLIALFRLGTTNIERQIPWPWLTWYASLEAVGVIVTLRSSAFLTGVIFLIWPVIVLTALALLAARQALTGIQRIGVAAAAFALPYYHYAISRPDFDHLAMSIAPLLVLVLALPFFFPEKSRMRLLAMATVFPMVAAVTFYTAGKASYFYKKQNMADLAEVEVTGERLFVEPYTAAVVQALNRIGKEFVAPADGIVVLPFWPTAYVILDKRSPIREIYMTFAETDERQRAIIADLERQGIKWAIVGDIALDGDDSWRMKNRNPLVWNYFADNFVTVDIPGLPENYRFLRRM